jgi:glycerol-3-phosphate dehydrogenase
LSVIHHESLSHMSVRFIQPGDPASDLCVDRRRRDIETLPSKTDVIVIGGGITGVGVALDAASRGLGTILLEGHDLAFGTSRWSSKLVHGGLRYLATGDVAVAWESAVERRILMDAVAPFLIRPQANVVPIMTDTPIGSAALTRLGFAAGDILRFAARSRRSSLPTSRILTAARTKRLLPALDSSRVRGGLLSWDGSLEDDARLVVAVARTASAYGATILTRTQVLSASGDGVMFRDETSGITHTIHARHVINATGVWAAQFDDEISVAPSRGTHVIFPAELFDRPKAAMTVPVPGMRARYCFVLPRPDGYVIAGITDVAEPGPIADVPPVPHEDVEWICDNISSSLDRTITANDAVGSFTGLRPLVHTGDTRASADISRHHLIKKSPEGVITITGGKLTTYRHMAEQVVNSISDEPCQTTRIALVGAGPLTHASNLPARLIRRFGSEAPRVAALADTDPSLMDPVAPHVPVRKVEVLFAIRAEGAMTPEDVMERRTRLSLIPTEAAAAHECVTKLCAETLSAL